MLTRRAALFGLLAGMLLTVAPSADAGVARALTLTELVKHSERVVVATPVEAYSVWDRVGDQRRIVTYSRIQIEQTIDGKSGESELIVRTLGGKVGDIGQIVHGEVVLPLRKRAMLFLRRGNDGSERVVGRTQGYYRLEADAAGAIRLRTSPGLSKLVGLKRSSAVQQLSGLSIAEAVGRLRQARTR